MAVENISGLRTDISETLAKLREISSKSKALSSSSEVAPSKSFSEVMSIANNTFANVNQMQAESEKLKDAYITGEGNVSLSQVVLSSEKSKIAFEGLIAVRNKILEAYKEIMNMPV